MTDTKVTYPQTTAQRSFQAQENGLKAAVTLAESRLDDQATSMTKEQLAADLAADGRVTMGYPTPKPSAAKAEFAKVWVQRRLARSNEQKALWAAREAATADARADENIEALHLQIVDAPAKLAAALADASRDGTSPYAPIRVLASKIEWSAVEFATLSAAVDYVAVYRTRRFNGEDPADIAIDMTRKLIERSQIRWHGPNLRVSGDGVTRLGAMHAAQTVLDAIGAVLPDDIKNVLGVY